MGKLNLLHLIESSIFLLCCFFRIPKCEGFTIETTAKSRSVSFSAQLMARIPELNDWRLLKNGGVSGKVRFHPVIEDGDLITTSPLADSKDNKAKENTVVVTASGSKYRLRSEAVSGKKSTATPIVPLNLNGKAIGSERVQYFLTGKSKKSTSGKSQIWTAYRSDTKTSEDSQPQVDTSQLYVIKMISDEEIANRENDNYRKIASGVFSGRFVNRVDYFPVGVGLSSFDRVVSALVIEAGYVDLKAILAAKKGLGLKGRALRNAAAVAGQCVQAVHASGMVWTDLKAENFVLLGGGDGSDESNELQDLRGIDLESAVPRGSNPVDYSPEACPPEFASALMNGLVYDYCVDFSYDIWSLGMFLFELATGRPYFGEGKSALAITKELANPNFTLDVSSYISDSAFADLVQKCLSLDPRKRPTITSFLLHPYFLTTGIGPISF